MANKVKRKFLLLWAKTLALCISLLGAFICTNVAVGGQRQEAETAPLSTPVDTSQNMPIKIKKIRIGSSASREFRKETSEEITIRETTVPPFQPVGPPATKVKETKSVEKVSVPQVYGNIQIGKPEDFAPKKP